ncbi:MAG: NAD(P)-dependent oxidoreductase, partial [Flammeovirgaceae bacterium]
MKRETKAILVLGGTSRMGAHVIDAALGNGLRVTVLARNPEKIQNRMEQPNLEILKGDVTCFPDVYNAVQGNDAIINVLGYDGADGDIITRGTANIIAAVAKSKIQKTICLSSFGVGSTELHSSWLFRALVRLRGMQQLFQAKAL